MPTSIQIKGYRFFFSSLDKGEPPHTHVEKGGDYAKFWLAPIALEKNRGFRGHELTEIRKLIEGHAQTLLEKWHAHFNR